MRISSSLRGRQAAQARRSTAMRRDMLTASGYFSGEELAEMYGSKDVLAALPREDMSRWAVGLWFFANNAWLPGEARPAELLGGPEGTLVIEAARRLSEPEPL